MANAPEGGSTSQSFDPSLFGSFGSPQELQVGTMGGGYVNRSVLPTDSVNVGSRAAGYKTGPGQMPLAQLRMQTPGLDPDSMSYSQAQGLVGNWYASDPKFYKQFVNKLITYKVPGANADMGMPEVASAWDDLLKTAITLNKGREGGKQFTPWDVLESYNRPAGSMGTYKSGDWLIDAATGEKVKYIGPKTKTTKQRVVDLSDSDQVEGIATQALTQLIGRAPTDKELAQFKATLNGYEKGHPEVTTTTEHYDDMGNVVASDVVHSGGVDEAARASLVGKGVKKTKEYAKYQSGVTAFNWLMQAVGGG